MSADAPLAGPESSTASRGSAFGGAGDDTRGDGPLGGAGARQLARGAEGSPAAAHAAGAPAWASPDLAARLQWLAGLERTVRARTDLLVSLIHEEVGKSRWEALATDVLPLMDSIRWHRRHAARVLRGEPVHGRPWWMVGMRHRRTRVALGHVAIIATWNYPVQLLGIQVVQALMAGNRVTVKPSERAPRAQAALLEACAIGLPRGTLEWTSADRAAGEALLRDRRFDHVVFTGSTEVGRVVAETCARTLTPTTLELSGCDSALVLADADPALAARAIWDAVTLNAGQTCMAPRRVIVDARVWPRFVECLAPRVAASHAAHLVCSASAQRVAEAVRDAVAQGGRPLGGVVEMPQGRSWRPAAVAGGSVTSDLSRGRHFGPALSVLAAGSMQAAIELHQRYDQHLAVSVWCRDRTARALARDRMFLGALRAGVVTFNDAVRPTAHPASSIAGSGASGWGATRGEAGLRALSREVSVSTTAAWPRVPGGEPSPGIQRAFRRMLRL